MVARISRLIFLLAIIAITLYLVLLNRDPVTLHLTGNTTYTAMGGVVFIVVFVLGGVTASVVAIFFGIRSYLRERQLLGRERQRKALTESLQLARGYAAAKEWNKARSAYELAIKRHPHEAIPRVELSKVLEGQGDSREALRIIDLARAESPTNIEVLLRAAELNMTLGNRTAAIDNLALVIAQEPNRYATELARDLSEELERFDDALEYQERLDALGGDHQEAERVRSRIRFKELVKSSPDATALRDNLHELIKRDSGLMALEKLAELELAQGNRESAAQLYAKLGRQEVSLSATRKAVELWSELSKHDLALSAVRAFNKEASGESRLLGELEIIRTYLNLGMLDQGRSALSKLPQMLSEFDSLDSAEILNQAATLQAYAHLKFGEASRCEAILNQLLGGKVALVADSTPQHRKGPTTEAPAPRLSTP